MDQSKKKPFKEIKQIVDHNVLLAYKFVNKSFKSRPMIANFSYENLLKIKSNQTLYMVENKRPSDEVFGNRKITAQHFQKFKITSNYIIRPKV